ncbi:MAG TPA: CPBP family intramembrane metalloprotease, partial [Flavobacteriia bacterium]|nr:CPBP family intramembrane metalloprotease [Flavobacteriia bacterium]
KGKNDFWRYLLGFLVIFIGWQVIGMLPLFAVAFSYAENLQVFQESANENFMNLGIDKNLFLFLMLISFIVGLLSIFFVVKKIHQRKVITLITARKKMDWKRVFFSFSLWFLISTILLVISYYGNPDDFKWNFKPMPFLILIFLSFLLLPLQTSFEELLFRGYLMQGFGVLLRNAWLPLLITSVIFGLLHGANPEVEKLGYWIFVYYIGTGLFLGLLTILDDGTELALGFHAANNIVAAVFVTQSWVVFQTDALFISFAEPTLGFESFFPVVVLYPILLIVFAKKYQWKNWKEKLFGKIENPFIDNQSNVI